ncbi:FHA domain-containing protein [Sorangium sp. So ce834]|uniref:FHA domain-containing protein n=1 Tax=Sorangium sp. So ce834 TaxID=3133321 RepID=UPI003F5E3B7F
MRPCPNCAWMLKETDAACTMCGASVAGAAPSASGPVAPPPPVQGGAGAYAPPGPPGYPGQSVASGYGGAVPQGYGAVGGAQGAYPPPPQVGVGGGLAASPGGVPFSSGADSPFPVSPWARAAPSAGLTSQPSSPPMNQPGVTPAQPPLASPIPGIVPGAPMGGAMGQPAGAPSPVFGTPPQMVAQPPMVVPTAAPGMVAPPPMVQGGAVAPPPLVQGGAVAPPPLVQGGAVAPPPLVQGGAVAPPPMVQGGVPAAAQGRAPAIVAPPMVQGAVPAAVQPVPGQPSRVLVGFLVTFQNDPGGSFWPIYSGRTQVGRAGADPATEIGLPDASASSRHASLHADPTTGQVFIEDDGSRNGTFVNEQRLGQGERRQLRDNDRLRLGSTTFVVKVLVA